jgi:uncharacterized protein YjbJ (UPF0337 family)
MTIGVVVPAEPDEKDVHECAIEALVNVADSHSSLNPVPYGRESASLSWGTRPDSQCPRRSATRRTEGARTIQATEVFLAIIVKHREFKMDWNRWKQVNGKVKEKWGNLTDDDLTAINGQRDQLEGKTQERYGLAKDKVRKDVDDWYNTQTW